MRVSCVHMDRGSTLVEVTIASAVLAVSIVATLSAMSTSRMTVKATQEEALALQLASKRMNSLRAMGYQEIEALLGDSTFEPCPVTGEDSDDHTYVLHVLGGRNGVLPAGAQRVMSDDGTLIVEVTVIWSSMALGREMSQTLFWRAAP